jgi:glycosyltransferase involved in cell wall biosynthesis
VLALNGKWLSQPVTGTQRYATEIARRLLTLHPGPVVLHLPADAALPDWVPDRVQVRRSRLRGQAFEQLALPFAARSQLLLSLGGPAPLMARRQIATMHDATPFRLPHTYSTAFGSWYRLMYRVLARRARAIVTVSEFSAAELADVLRIPRSRLVVAGNGADHLLDLEPVRPDGIPEAPFVLAVGTLARHKNLGPTLAALDEAELATVVVGAAGSRRIFEQQQQSPLGHVVFTGRLTDAEVAWLYRHALCLVFPSLYEGFGLPVIEAQRLGCPVVVSDRASLPEVAGSGAEMVDAAHPHDVALAVERVATDSELRAGLIERGHHNAERHTWRASAEAVAQLVAQELASGAEPV